MNGFWIAVLIFAVLFGAAFALLGAANRREASDATGSAGLGREAARRDKAARQGARRPGVGSPHGP